VLRDRGAIEPDERRSPHVVQAPFAPDVLPGHAVEDLEAWFELVARELLGQAFHVHGLRGADVNLAGVASARGEHECAARLLGAGEAMMETAGMTLNPGTAIEYERHVGRTRTALGEAEYERAVRAGRELDRDAAIEYALRG